MKNFYKLLLFTFISTSITAQYQIGDTYEDCIIYGLHYHPNIHGQNLLEIKIVQMQNHLYGNIIAVQNATNQLVEGGWEVPIFDDFVLMHESSTDTYGDSCTEWYDVNEYPGSLGCEGAYNSHEFNALEQCCVCQGAQENQRLIAPSESIKDGQSIIFMDISLLFDSNLNLLTFVVNDLNEDKLFYYEMYDLLGKRLFKGQLESVETVVPIASLSPGVYVLRVNTLNNETLKTLKFIKN